MLINVTLPLQSATRSPRPSPERPNQPPTSPDADSSQASAATNDFGSLNQPLTAVQASSNADPHPIEDAAAADTATDFAKNSIQLDPGTALLAQANPLPETVLELLQ